MTVSTLANHSGPRTPTEKRPHVPFNLRALPILGEGVLQPIKLCGTVKSYNPGREYSFIIPDVEGSISLEHPHTLHFTTRSLTRLYSTVSKRLVSQSPHR